MKKPEEKIHEFLETHCVEAGISLSDLLQNPAFHVSYQAAIVNLKECSKEVDEQVIIKQSLQLE